MEAVAPALAKTAIRHLVKVRLSSKSASDPGWKTPSVLIKQAGALRDRKSTRLNSSHGYISYAVFCLKKKKKIVHLTLFSFALQHLSPLMRVLPAAGILSCQLCFPQDYQAASRSGHYCYYAIV